MPTDAEGGEATLAPDEAFSVLGNETRMELLQILAEADDPLSFSELYDRGSATDSGNFTYHLDKLVGHFVEDTDEGYDLRRAGERIIEAVVSGAVTETPVIDPTQTEWPCSQCGGRTVVSYRQERVAVSCPDCPGLYGEASTDDPVPDEQLEQGYLGAASLPPAGIQGRNAEEVFRAALGWDFLERIAMSNDICPRCSAVVDRTLTVCENHDPSDGLCERCHNKYQAMFSATCPNCPFEMEGLVLTAVHGYPEVLNFVTAHGFNPVVPTKHQWQTMADAQEVEVLSTDPVEVRITYSLEGHTLSLTVDEDLTIIDITEDDRASA